jgi:N-acetyl-anhydromuramyl-L-alanine amidase AmpD
MVPDDQKAWTAGDWNSRSLNIEQIGFASQSKAFWKKETRRQLNAGARIVAEWSIKYDIPLVHRAPNGVAGHVDVSGPGGHWDPGPNFPWTVFLLMARLHKRRLLRRRNQKINQSMRTRIMRALRR